MAKNKIQDGKTLRLTVGSTVDAGDPVLVGNALTGVALTDYSAADGKASIALEGVFDLSVKGIDDAGNSAVAVGDRIYYVTGDTPVLSKKKSGKFFGVALETVTTGATATINVKLAPVNGDGAAPYKVFAAGLYTVNDSPLAAAEVIPVEGILATDVVLVTIAVNGGSPDLYIISAIGSVSPDVITVTASGTFTAGDKLNYLVLRASS